MEKQVKGAYTQLHIHGIIQTRDTVWVTAPVVLAEKTIATISQCIANFVGKVGYT